MKYFQNNFVELENLLGNEKIDGNYTRILQTILNKS